MEDPDQFDRFTSKKCAEKHDDKCITHIYGIYEGKDAGSKLQALRYDKDIWTEASAKSHCKSKDGMFEPAKKEEDIFKNKETTMAIRQTNRRSPFKIKAKSGHKIQNETFNCECIECGHEMESERHCKDIKCPECGGDMRRKERPGPGEKTSKVDEATVYIYDEIGWFGIEAETFAKDLNALTAKTVHIRLNSPGGNVFEGTAIANTIKQHKSKTVIHIDGLAASISSIIALAGDEVLMAENAFFMFHEAWSFVIGNADGLREEADLLDKIDGVLAKEYAKKMGIKENEGLDYMKAETWWTAEEALKMGMIDGIEKDKDEKASATMFDLSVFANVPDILKDVEKELNERDCEQALRDAGASRSRAKEILAKGFQAVRDAQTEPVKKDVRDAQTDDKPPQRDAEPAKIKEGSTQDLLTKADIVMATTK